MSEGDKPVAGGMQAFEICEDFPEGEVCREVELEVCHTSNDAVDKPCLEVEVQILILGMWVGMNCMYFPT